MHYAFKTRWNPFGILTLLVFLYCQAGCAPSATLSHPGQGQEPEIPVVLTPTQLPQRIDESPNTVTIIDREMIEASGARSLLDVLRLVPGFYVGTKNNHFPTAGYHGLADEFSRRLLLLVDGQRIFQYARGVILWNSIPIPLENVERIEVIRGPSAAVYGSNANQAVINIQTRNPAEDRGVLARGTVGTDGVRDSYFRYGGTLGALDYTLSLYNTRDSGYPAIDDDRRDAGIAFVGELPITPTAGLLKLWAGYTHGHYQVGGRPSDGITIAQGQGTSELGAREFPATEAYQALEYRQPISGDAEWGITLAHSLHRYLDKGFGSDRLLPGVNLKVQFDIEEERFNADFKFTQVFNDRFRMVGGLGYYHEAVTSPFYFDTDESLGNDVAKVYAHGEYRLSDRLVLNAGAMLEHSALSSRDWLFLPRLSAHYHLDDHQTLRAVYSTGSRQPTTYETDGRAVVRGENVPLTLYRVFATGGLLGGLKPEYNRSYELGYRWLPNRSTSLDVRVFREELSDFIVAFYREDPALLTVLPNHTVLDFANENDMTVQGVEAQFDWRSAKGLRLFASYGFTDIDAGGTQFNRGYEASAPRHSFGLLLSQRFANGWEASLNYDYQSRMQWYLDDPIDHYQKLDVRIAKRFHWGDHPALAEVIGTNLLGPYSDLMIIMNFNRSVAHSRHSVNAIHS